MIGAAGIGGLAAGFVARPSAAPEPAVLLADIPPAEAVNLRFPAEWAETISAASPAVLAFASADGGFSLFSPIPLGVISEAKAEQVEPVEQAQPEVAKPVPAAKVAAAKMQLAAVTSRPAVAPVRRSNSVLSESQIASIKRRLNLTPQQERYWPAVEAELRKMEYKRDGRTAQGSRMAQVDMSKVNIDGLRSAGYPLVMSFSDDQRRELRSLAHLLGLENVMSGF